MTRWVLMGGPHDGFESEEDLPEIITLGDPVHHLNVMGIGRCMYIRTREDGVREYAAPGFELPTP